MKKTNVLALLAEKQFWKIGDGYLQVYELGKLLVHYKMMKQPGKRGARTQSTTITTLVDYLQTHSAELVGGVTA